MLTKKHCMIVVGLIACVGPLAIGSLAADAAFRLRFSAAYLAAEKGFVREGDRITSSTRPAEDDPWWVNTIQDDLSYESSRFLIGLALLIVSMAPSVMLFLEADELQKEEDRRSREL